MRTLKHLFDNNRRWVERITGTDPEFFHKLSRQQAPDHLWIGCSDSRVPANDIVGLLPGELFVHRNVANVVVHSDLNCQAVIQFAVEILEVEHIIVCGHHGCGGVRAAMEGSVKGLVENWLRHVQDIFRLHLDVLRTISDPIRRADRLCELNVIEQVINVCRTSVVQGAWKRGRPLNIHGWIYSVENGLLRDMNICVTKPDEVATIYERAISPSI